MTNIFNTGSLNLDEVYHLHHIVRPGETTASDKMVRHAGGKGLNQSIALARAGVKNVHHIGHIGKDGEILLDMLVDAGVDISGIVISDEPTGRAIIQVAENGENAIFLFAGANRTWNEADIQGLVNKASSNDILLIQNEINGVSKLLEAAAGAGMRLAMNPTPMTPEIKQCPLDLLNWLIVNEMEARELVGLSIPDKDDLDSQVQVSNEELAEELHSLYPKTIVAITLGKLGAIRIDSGGITTAMFPDVAPVVDTTGAGDTFTGYWLHAELSNYDIREGLTRACASAALSVTRSGAAESIPFESEVNNVLKEFIPIS